MHSSLLRGQHPAPRQRQRAHPLWPQRRRGRCGSAEPPPSLATPASARQHPAPSGQQGRRTGRSS
eukprot:12630734-Alexandrium_andersonii.AAC.1